MVTFDLRLSIKIRFAFKKGYTHVRRPWSKSKTTTSLTLIFKTSSLIDSLTSVSQIVVEYDGIYNSVGYSSDSDKKFVF